MLFGSFVAVVFGWSFLASSLILCGALIGLYQVMPEYQVVGMVFALSVLASVAFALSFGILVTYKVPPTMAARLSKDMSEPDRRVVEASARLAKRLGMPAPRLLEADGDALFAYSVGSGEGVVVLSRGLLAGLDGDEVETVVAHELAHIRNKDTRVNTIIAVYKRVLFFDPFIRLIEKAVHGEKEFSADDLSGRETQKPLALASALVKIGATLPTSWSMNEGLAILGRPEALNPPTVKERVERLIRLEAELEGRRPRPGRT